MKKLATDVLVVGGGTGGVAAAISAARHGVKTILATEFSWLGGMLTSAGVAAPDGNELEPWQTGLWGAYLQELQQKQAGGLDNGWVSLFTYHPGCGAAIFADWVAQIPNLEWIKNCVPRSVVQQNQLIRAVQFDDAIVEAQIVIDATELGDLLALGEIPYRWGWESATEFNEPSLQQATEFNNHCDLSDLSSQYPVQAPTWVFLLQDYSKGQNSSNDTLALDSLTNQEQFRGAWENYGTEKFLNYGKLTDSLYMINWPISGNDYGDNLDRLIGSETAKQEWFSEAYNHSLDFAHYLQTELEPCYGVAQDIFPQAASGFALHPYYRESRRIVGKTTVTEHNILPVNNGCVAPLPVNEQKLVDAIAIGNYANDHHYPGVDFPLQPKSIRWGGRWTGTPFTIPYSALIPQAVDGLLVAEKNIAVSHIANGSTRLQPVVMNIGQAAGVAAALCIEQNCQPRELAVRKIQEALLTDSTAPAAVIPLFNVSLGHPEWLYWQRYYLDHPEAYNLEGICPCKTVAQNSVPKGNYYQGILERQDYQQYRFRIVEPNEMKHQVWQLITINHQTNQQLCDLKNHTLIRLVGRLNHAGNWLIVEAIL